MKPPPFEYVAPTTLAQALELLAERGEDGKVIAGGQSLVPLLNFRLARPDILIDINRIPGMSSIRRHGGELLIGALTRHASVASSPLIRDRWPLLRGAVEWVAHPQIRNRGTIGGSVCHADPSAEMPVVLTALCASFRIVSLRGEREVGYEEMFQGQLESAVAEDELLVEIRVPATAPGSGWSFQEFARRKGDFALGGAAVSLSLDGAGACESVAISLLGAAPTPYRARAAEAQLLGSDPAESAAAVAARAVDGIEPTGDLHGSSEYRRDLIEVLTRRAILEANERAKAAVR